MKNRWALMLSGRGSTAQALLDQLGDWDIRLVVSSKKSAPGILRARRLGVPVLLFGKNSSWKDLTGELKARGIERVFLVGFMRILPADFVQAWKGRILNIHPSLLPSYPGLEAMKKSFDAKARMGVTLHEVTPEMDAGPVFLRGEIERAESWEQTELRMARLEQRLLREAAERLWLKGAS